MLQLRRGALYDAAAAVATLSGPEVQGQEEDQEVPQEQEEGQVRLLDEEVREDAQKVQGYLQRVLMLRLRRRQGSIVSDSATVATRPLGHVRRMSHADVGAWAFQPAGRTLRCCISIHCDCGLAALSRLRATKVNSKHSNSGFEEAC